MKRADTKITTTLTAGHDGPNGLGSGISQPKGTPDGRRPRSCTTQKGRSTAVSSYVDPNIQPVAREDLVRPAIARTCASESDVQHQSHSRRRASPVRFSVDPRDLPPEKIARRLHLALVEFLALKSELKSRGFPEPDRSTGMYDSVAVERWMDARSHLTAARSDDAQTQARDSRQTFAERMRRLTG
jgi:hypothetical protein